MSIPEFSSIVEYVDKEEYEYECECEVSTDESESCDEVLAFRNDMEKMMEIFLDGDKESAVCGQQNKNARQKF